MVVCFARLATSRKARRWNEPHGAVAILRKFVRTFADKRRTAPRSVSVGPNLDTNARMRLANLSMLERRPTSRHRRSPMRADRSSQTAEFVAMHRAAHQLLDAPPLLDDPFAMLMTDPRFSRAFQADPESKRAHFAPARRAFLAARSRYTEDRLAHAVEQGCPQYVVLGAGFDTFCLRSKDRALRIFEIDHPATQATKLARLRDAGANVGPRTSFHAADFTLQPLKEILLNAGVDPTLRVFVSWLGVAQYLPREIIRAALADIASFSAKVDIVFDYTLHYDLQNEAQRFIFNTSRRIAEWESEPFRSMFRPDEIVELCGDAGFGTVTTTNLDALNTLYCEPAGSSPRIEGINQLAYARVEL